MRTTSGLIGVLGVLLGSACAEQPDERASSGTAEAPVDPIVATPDSAPPDPVIATPRPALFVDITDEVGLDFRYRTGHVADRYLTPEIMARIPARILRVHVPGATLADALPHLHETYCGTIAYEIEHIASHRQRTWLREKIESGAFRQPLSPDEQKALLKRLIEVDALERFMHKAYLGQKQFSIEGLDMTVPMEIRRMWAISL